MDDTNVIELTPEKIAKLKNLKPYKNKTDDEIRDIWAKRTPREKKPRTPITGGDEDTTLLDYERRFSEKLDIFQREFGVDINDSNDAEGLRNLARFQIQLENVSKQIDDMQRDPSPTKDDVMIIKNLGDFQRSLITSIADTQANLGISRKQRKEKQVDDIPKWIDGILEKSKTFFDRKTVTVDCPKCMIELFRYWVNFPGEENNVELSLTCWKCKEIIYYTG